MFRRPPIGLLFLFLPVLAYGQRLEFAPGAKYDARIPHLRQVTGADFGERVTAPEDILRYFNALHAAAPDRTALVEYATTWEGRKLIAMVIAAPERINQIEQIKSGLRRLANPASVSASEIEELIKQLPVVVTLTHGVHGNEISSGEAAMAEAYHLLAVENDPNADLIRRESIVLIDPMQNPDGRARFVFQNLLGQAATPDDEPAAAEHDEPWPGGRANHYLFDLNRDWFAQTQPESQGRVRLLLEWMPHVVVDLHEMGGDSTYYFPPSAEPGNPFLTRTQSSWLSQIGQNNAARFDERGFAYFNREVFDAFYPGYGVSWPTAQGAIGMTFEMASARGLAYRRQDETQLTYLDGAVRHFTSALMTATTAARNREKMLRDYVEFRRTAGAGATKAYLLLPGRDPGQAQRLAKTLAANGIVVERATENVKVDTRSYPPGTFIVPLPQPAGMLARNLLDAQVSMNAEFLRVQEERRKRRLPDQIYDITAWNLPMLHDVECVAVDKPFVAKTEGFKGNPSISDTALPDAIVGYALPWNASSAKAVVEALRAGLRPRFLAQSFTIAGRKFDRGTAFFRSSENGPDLKVKLAPIVAANNAQAIKLDSAFVSEGISLGSNQTVALKLPKVLLAWDAPTSSLSAGWSRFVLERRYAQPVTAVRVNSMARVDLYRYDVLVLPSGTYNFAPDVLRRIKDWMAAGGTLVTLGEASRWAARESVGLLETRTELRDGTPELDAPTGPAGGGRTDRPAPATQSADYLRAIQPVREQPELVPGAILRVLLDADHWLGSGTDGEIQAMVDSTRVFSPIKLDKGRNVGVYAEKDRLLASGLVWEVAANQLPQKAFLIHQPVGRGHLIAFAEDPNYRAYAEATAFLFINAVLLGAAY